MLRVAAIVLAIGICALSSLANAESPKISDEELNTLNRHAQQIQSTEKLKGYTLRLVPDASKDVKMQGCIILPDGSICCGSRAACGERK